MRPRPPRISPARVAAARALVDLDRGAHLEEALVAWSPGSGADRDQAWFLAFGVNRRRSHVDAALRPHLSRSLGSLDPEVRAILRVGAFEALFARTQPHAVVHQAVAMTRPLGVGRASGLVNAVLRRVQTPTDLRGAELLDHPDWLVARWTERYGAAATEAWCHANNQPPPLFIVSRGDGGTLPEGAVPVDHDGHTVPRCFRIVDPRGPIPALPGFAEGHWWVQDLASVRVADLVEAGPGETILDACGAPGGKAFRLASTGAHVVATDRDADRLARIDTGATRLGLAIETHTVDWCQPPAGDQTFDAVLVDAPCSGLGTVGRHPEIRWRRQPTDLAIAARTQGAILTGVAPRIRSGGRLVYAVCSPEPEEGREVVEGFLATHDGFALEAVVETAPPTQGEDGHFAARLRRSG